MCYSRPVVYAYLSNFVSIGLFCRPLAAKNPQFLPYFAIFWISAFSGFANWQQSDKIEHGCTTANHPLSNGINIVFVLQRLHGEIGRTISCRCTDGVKFGTKEETQGPLLRAKFHSHRCNVLPLRGENPQNRHLSNLLPARCAARNAAGNKAIVDYTSPALCTPVSPFPPIGDAASRQHA